MRRESSSSPPVRECSLAQVLHSGKCKPATGVCYVQAYPATACLGTGDHHLCDTVLVHETLHSAVATALGGSTCLELWAHHSICKTVPVLLASEQTCMHDASLLITVSHCRVIMQPKPACSEPRQSLLRSAADSSLRGNRDSDHHSFQCASRQEQYKELQADCPA